MPNKIANLLFSFFKYFWLDTELKYRIKLQSTKELKNMRKNTKQTTTSTELTDHIGKRLYESRDILKATIEEAILSTIADDKIQMDEKVLKKFVQTVSGKTQQKFNHIIEYALKPL